MKIGLAYKNRDSLWKQGYLKKIAYENDHLMREKKTSST